MEKSCFAPADMGAKDAEAYDDDDDKSRDNGWSCPPHPLQIAAWIVIIMFAVFYFTSLVPALHSSWQPAGYIVPGVSLFLHLICHIVACTIDPADPAVLMKKYPKKKFDRTQHKHVIENCHCYICQVDVANRSKHCSICNKCVSDFDHHCKWLNNCVGGRNYKWFLATLVTATVALVLIFIVSLTEFIVYFTDKTDRKILQPYRDLNSSLEYTEADFNLFYRPIPHDGWLAFLGVYFILCAIAIGLLVHLFGFHIYLIYNNMSTYDYIVQQRDTSREDDVSSIASTSRRNKTNRIMPAKDRDLKTSDLRKYSDDKGKTTIVADPKDYKKILEEAEAQHRSPGETPPPSASPIHSLEKNNNSKLVESPDEYVEQLTAVKKLRKKKKKRSTSQDENYSSISTIDNPQMYQNKGYTISKVDIPASANPVRILPPPMVTPKGVGVAKDYHSDSADSLLEVPTNKSYTFNTMGSNALSLSLDNVDGKAHSLSLDNIDNKEAKRRKTKKKKKEASQSIDDLNSTTLFSVNENAKFNEDGSLDYSGGFQTLPLTPTAVRKAQTEMNIPKVKEVPKLDLTGIHGSHESVSFQPYTATFRSTDTVLTDRLLPTLKEEKIKSKLNPVIDTEV
ncbi:putative palmitoyltransferase zdhhc1 [Mactra antiquata]